jgi:predicted dehydrogenase
VTRRLKVAIIGATGIGKHHGKWYAMEGCDVAAFVGSSDESVARTRAAMTQVFAFDGRGYTDVARMLAAERPDAVSVCSPHHLHREHAVGCLEAGAHVLCEKPLVWDAACAGDGLLADGQSMITAANRAGRVLAINTQYVAAVRPYLDLYERRRGLLRHIARLDFQMESKGGVGGPNEYDDIWVDLASHPLSVMLRLLPGAVLARDTACCVIRRDDVTAQFDMELSDGARCPVRIALRNVYEGAMARKLGANGLIAELSGANDDHGIYRTVISADGERVQCDDLVHTSVRCFVDAARGSGEPLVTAADGLRNLELQLALFERARRE